MKIFRAVAAAAVLAFCGAGGALADTHSPNAGSFVATCANGSTYTFVSPAGPSHVGQAIEGGPNLIALAISVVQNGVEVQHFGQATVRNPNAIACVSDLGGGARVIFTGVLSG